MCRTIQTEIRLIRNFKEIVTTNGGEEFWSFLRQRAAIMTIFGIISVITFVNTNSKNNSTNTAYNSYAVGGASGTYIITALGVACYLISTVGIVVLLKSRHSSGLVKVALLVAITLGLSSSFYFSRFIVSIISATQGPSITNTSTFIYVAITPLFNWLSFAIFLGIFIIVYKLYLHLSRNEDRADLLSSLNPNDFVQATAAAAHAAPPVVDAIPIPIFIKH